MANTVDLELKKVINKKRWIILLNLVNMLIVKLSNSSEDQSECNFILECYSKIEFILSAQHSIPFALILAIFASFLRGFSIFTLGFKLFLVCFLK